MSFLASLASPVERATMPGESVPTPTAPPQAQGGASPMAAISHLNDGQRNAMLAYLEAGGDPEDALNLVAQSAFSAKTSAAPTEFQRNHAYLQRVAPEAAETYLARMARGGKGDGNNFQVITTPDGSVLRFDRQSGKFEPYGDPGQFARPAPERESSFDRSLAGVAARAIPELDETIGSISANLGTIGQLSALAKDEDVDFASVPGSDTARSVMYYATPFGMHEQSVAKNQNFDALVGKMVLGSLEAIKGPASDADLRTVASVQVTRDTPRDQAVKRLKAAEIIERRGRELLLQKKELLLAQQGVLTAEQEQWLVSEMDKASAAAVALVSGEEGEAETPPPARPSSARPPQPEGQSLGPRARLAQPGAPLPEAGSDILFGHIRDKTATGARQALEEAEARGIVGGDARVAVETEGWKREDIARARALMLSDRGLEEAEIREQLIDEGLFDG